VVELIGLIKPVLWVFVFFICGILLIKTCGTEVREFREFFHGILVAAVHELTLTGGRAAKANIFLSILLGLLFVFILLPDELREFREFLDGTPSSGNAKYLLFGCLIFFFLLSLCFVFAIEMYSKKTHR